MPQTDTPRTTMLYVTESAERLETRRILCVELTVQPSFLLDRRSALSAPICTSDTAELPKGAVHAFVTDESSCNVSPDVVDMLISRIALTLASVIVSVEPNSV